MKEKKHTNLVKRILTGAVLTVTGITSSANAEDQLCIVTNAPIVSEVSYLYNLHKEGSLEGNDGSDTDFNDNGQKVKFYSRNSLCFPDKLQKDSRPLESMTTYSNEFDGVNLTAPTDVDITYWTNGGFEGKNVISRLTDGSDSTIEVYDAKQLAINHPYPASAFTIQVDNGITKKLKTEFHASADLNIDGKVDMKDFAILSKNWGNSVTHTDVYDENNFADINRDGTVDVSDLATLANQWLYVKPAE